MGLWARVRELAGGAQRRLLTDLGTVYRGELQLAHQLRVHAERVPYPDIAARLLALADQEDAHAALVRAEIARQGATAGPADVRTPPWGRNYWERLTHDLEALRTKSKRYRELAQHWDLEDGSAAALLARLAHEDAAMSRVIADLIARSDPHAQD